MKSARILQQSGRQICRILTAQRYRYHDLSRASVIGSAVDNSSEFEVSNPMPSRLGLSLRSISTPFSGAPAIEGRHAEPYPVEPMHIFSRLVIFFSGK